MAAPAACLLMTKTTDHGIEGGSEVVVAVMTAAAQETGTGAAGDRVAETALDDDDAHAVIHMIAVAGGDHDLVLGPEKTRVADMDATGVAVRTFTDESHRKNFQLIRSSVTFTEEKCRRSFNLAASSRLKDFAGEGKALFTCRNCVERVV